MREEDNISRWRIASGSLLIVSRVNVGLIMIYNFMYIIYDMD